MDMITLVAVSLLVTERIIVHIITGIKRCKSKFYCFCNISKDEETVGTPRMEIPKKV
jgi:hypothetical protein